MIYNVIKDLERVFGAQNIILSDIENVLPLEQTVRYKIEDNNMWLIIDIGDAETFGPGASIILRDAIKKYNKL